jgi:hypothetical protein
MPIHRARKGIPRLGRLQRQPELVVRVLLVLVLAIVPLRPALQLNAPAPVLRLPLVRVPRCLRLCLHLRLRLLGATRARALWLCLRVRVGRMLAGGVR